MSTRLLIAAAAFAVSAVSSAFAGSPAAPVGRWLTQGGAAVVEIGHCGASLCGRVVGLRIEHPGDRSPLDWRGKPQCGLTILRDAQRDDAAWFGHITDPRNGGVWQVRLAPEPDGTLRLRGYLGIPLFGQTQVWTPYAAPLPANCRMLDTEQAAHTRSGPGRG